MLKRILKEYWYCFFVFILSFLLVFIKLPYTIERTGGLINLNDRIEGYETNGSFNMAYVASSDANVLTYLYSLIDRNWDAIPVNKNTTQKETDYLGKRYFQTSNQVAELVAYKLANKDIKIDKTHFYVTYVDENSKSDIEIGDEIIAINGTNITNENDISELINQSKKTVKLTVLNNDKKLTRTAKKYTLDGKEVIGILILPSFEFKSNLKFKSDNTEYGPSGGFMMALTIYDHITNSNLAKGRIIAGTGTIALDGTVGEIGGVKHKIKGAVNNGAEIFFVPKENYKEAINLKKKYNYSIDVVKITNIQEAIDYLKK